MATKVFRLNNNMNFLLEKVMAIRPHGRVWLQKVKEKEDDQAPDGERFVRMSQRAWKGGRKKALTGSGQGYDLRGIFVLLNKCQTVLQIRTGDLSQGHVTRGARSWCRSLL